jgi:gamma-glutamyltranspeptidase/glutathione hydrolase
MLSSMTPSIVEKEGKLFLVLGSPGGSTIPDNCVSGHCKCSLILEWDIQEAVDAGRFHHQWLPDWISYEKNAIDSIALLKT